MRQAREEHGHGYDAVYRVSPPIDLHPLVEAFAGRTALSHRARFPVFPTARAELMFHFADPFLIGDAASAPMRPLATTALLGPRMCNHWQSAGPRIDWFMVQLTALGCERLLGVRFAETWHREVPLAETWGVRLHDRLRAAATFSARVAIAIETLRARFTDVSDPLSRAGSLARAGGIRSVEALCARLDIGPRRLHQKFVACYGVSPKLFLSLMRFGRQLERRHPLLSHAGKADEPEYYDDSHAIREFRRFSGLTPSAYVRQKSAGDRLIHTGAPIFEPASL
jgi:AraC-like DNA-binding protein